MPGLPLFVVGLALAAFAPFMARALVAKLRRGAASDLERIRERAREIRRAEAEGEKGEGDSRE